MARKTLNTDQAEGPLARREMRIRKNPETYGALLAAALQVAGEHGYRETTIYRVVERANLGVGTFYHYFEAREDLLDSLFPFVQGRLITHLADSDEPLNAEQLFELLLAFVDDNANYLRIHNDAQAWRPDLYWVERNRLVDAMGVRLAAHGALTPSRLHLLIGIMLAFAQVARQREARADLEGEARSLLRTIGG